MKLSSLIAASALTALTSFSPVSALAETSTVADQLAETNAGVYNVDKTHAFLFWEVSHGGLSTYTTQFMDWDASIDFNPANPAESTVTATINPAALATCYHHELEKWHTELKNDFFNVDKFPKISFTSTSVETTGDNTGKVTGDLTFMGVTKPVTLDVTYNGVTNQPWYGERDIIGFDASTTITRSEFGLDRAINYGIGDEVTIRISAEFLEAEKAAE